MNAFLLRAAACALLAALPCAAQTLAPAPSKPRLVTENELVVRYFTPKAANAAELANVVGMSFGSNIMAFPEGTTADGPIVAPANSIRRAITVGGAVMVRDVPQQIEKVIGALEELDRLALEDQKRAEALTARIEIAQYRPRFASQDAAYSLLQTLGLSVDAIPESETLIFSADAETVAAGRKALEELDVPPREVTLTCLLVQGLQEAGGAPDPLLPADLAANLRALVPMPGFDVIATGVVRSTVTAKEIALESQIEGGLRYTLELRPRSFDERSGSLSVGACKFELRVPVFQGAAGNVNAFQSQEFRTALTLHAGEYTVMGAVGADPVFVVLKLVPAPAR
jgi:hypothetical protein